MNNTYTLLIIGIVIICFLLTLVVMVQNPKGGGLSSTFGGGANQIGGVKKTGDFLEKSTWTLATILVVLILLINSPLALGGVNSTDAKILENRKEQSVMPDAKQTQQNTTAKDSAK